METNIQEDDVKGINPPMHNHDVTVDQLHVEFNEKAQIWKHSSCRAAFLKIIDEKRPSGGWRFNKVVCLGIGTFHQSIPRQHGNSGVSMFQFVCVLDTVEELKKRGHTGETGIQVFAQDPDFSHKDVELISSKGVTVLRMERPMFDGGMNTAKQHLGPHTLLFEFGIEFPAAMCEDILQAEAGMHIGTSLEALREIGEFCDPAMVDEFDRTYASCAFPNFEERGGLVYYQTIYWPNSHANSSTGQQDVDTTSPEGDATDAKVVDDKVTLEQMQKRFVDSMKIWQKSTCKEAFLKIIDQEKPSEGWQFDKVVMLATGEFDLSFLHDFDDQFHGDMEERRMIQFACGVDTAKELTARGHTGSSVVQVFAQEPEYREKDLKLVASEGVTVLEMDPSQHGMNVVRQHVGPHTLLFEFGCARDKQMCRDLYELDIGMWIGMGSWWLREDLHGWDFFAMADTFDETHGSCDFPKFEEVPDTFDLLSIQWRVPQISHSEG